MCVCQEQIATLLRGVVLTHLADNILLLLYYFFFPIVSLFGLDRQITHGSEMNDDIHESEAVGCLEYFAWSFWYNLNEVRPTADKSNEHQIRT